MKRYISFFFLCLITISFTNSCQNKGESALEKVVSFNPADTNAIDALFDFYIESGIILPQMLRDTSAITPEHLHTYDCLIDGCEIIHDYMQDSLSSYFFMELSCLSGSCGNSIYILNKKDEQFYVLFNECGVIDPDLGNDEYLNNFKVLYFTKESKNYKLYFNGTEFISQLLEDNSNSEISLKENI